MFIILDSASNDSEQLQKKVNDITHSKTNKKNKFNHGSNYSRTIKKNNSVSLQITRSSDSRRSDDLYYDKKNYAHLDSDIEVITGIIVLYSSKSCSIHYYNVGSSSTKYVQIFFKFVKSLPI